MDASVLSLPEPFSRTHLLGVVSITQHGVPVVLPGGPRFILSVRAVRASSKDSCEMTPVNGPFSAVGLVSTTGVIGVIPGRAGVVPGQVGVATRCDTGGWHTDRGAASGGPLPRGWSSRRRIGHASTHQDVLLEGNCSAPHSHAGGEAGRKMTQTGATDHHHVVVLQHGVLHRGVLGGAHVQTVREGTHGDGVAGLKCSQAPIELVDPFGQGTQL